MRNRFLLAAAAALALHASPALADTADLVDPLIGSTSGRTRVICSHDPSGGLAEADVVLGLRSGRAVLAGAADEVGPEEIAELYT